MRPRPPKAVYEEPARVFELWETRRPVLIESPRGTGRAYMYTEGDTAHLCIRGTATAKDVLTDIDAVMHHVKDDVYVHGGFLDEFTSMEPQISAAIGADVTTLHISAHSLGAAVGQIAAAHYGDASRSRALRTGSRALRTVCHTVGCPRTGNAGFVRWFEKNVHENYRIANIRDPVPMVPAGYGWAHTMDRCVLLDTARGFQTPIQDDVWWRRVLDGVLDGVFHDRVRVEDHDIQSYITALQRPL